MPSTTKTHRHWNSLIVTTTMPFNNKRLLLFLILFLGLSPVTSELTIQDFGYRDLVVTISPDIPGDQADQVIAGIKVSLSQSSLRFRKMSPVPNRFLIYNCNYEYTAAYTLKLFIPPPRTGSVTGVNPCTRPLTSELMWPMSRSSFPIHGGKWKQLWLMHSSLRWR